MSKRNVQILDQEAQKLKDDFFKSIRPAKKREWRLPEEYLDFLEEEEDEIDQQMIQEEEENPLEEEDETITNKLKGFTFQCPVCGQRYENYVQHLKHCNPEKASKSDDKSSRKRKQDDRDFDFNVDEELLGSFCLCGVPIDVRLYLAGGICNRCDIRKFPRVKATVKSIYLLPPSFVPIHD